MYKYKVTSEFNAIDAIRHGVPHTGIDLNTPLKTDLRSVTDGWVSKIYDGSGTLGNGIQIKGLDGREYIYGHLDSISVKVGEAVKLGTFIGQSGSTGRSSGPHLHFAVKENGQYIDPSSYLPTLDKVTGIYTYGGASNTRAEMEALGCGQGGDSKWYDLTGRMQDSFDMKVCEQKQEFYAYLQALVETTNELCYAIALVGGGVLILFAVAGSTRAWKYFGVLQMSYILIRMLFGGSR